MSHHFDPNRPIYLQILEEIKRRTIRGIYPPGGKLPSVREMAVAMGVNPNTMARAYSELERDGFTSARRGEGSFVTEDLKRIDVERRALVKATVDGFVAEVRELGLDRAQIEEALGAIREALGDDRNP